MKILVIAPHADDEVLGVGGTVNKHLNNDHEVVLLICGVRAHDNLSNTQKATSHYTKAYTLNYKDEHYYESFDKMLKSVENVYNNVRPDAVYIPNKTDFNRDHRCVFEICEIVCRRYQKYPPKRVLMYETPSSTTQSFENNFKCNHYEVLTKEDITNKISKLLLYENEVREFPNPRSGKGLLVHSNYRGMECGVEYAEGFHIIYNKI